MAVRYISERQRNYLSQLYSDIKEKGVNLNVPHFSSVMYCKESEARELIQKIREGLGYKETLVINQYNKEKTISNIMIKEEWVKGDCERAGSNSILVWIPDEVNNRVIECYFPKGGREIGVKNDFGEMEYRKKGRLIYRARNKKMYNKKIKLSDWLACGVKLSWKQHFRVIDVRDGSVVEEKTLRSYEEFVEYFERINGAFKRFMNESEERIIREEVKRKAVRVRVNLENAEKGKNSDNNYNSGYIFDLDKSVDENGVDDLNIDYFLNEQSSF